MLHRRSIYDYVFDVLITLLFASHIPHLIITDFGQLIMSLLVTLLLFNWQMRIGDSKVQSLMARRFL